MAPSSRYSTPGHGRTCRIGVAVCTRNRTAKLERLLQSIYGQRRSPEEVVVVDNGPSDSETRRLVRNRFPNALYIVEPVEGLDFARNRALRAAASEFVAFIDDDATAESDWIENLEKSISEEPSLDVCTGRVLPMFLESEGQRLFEANGGLADGGESLIRLAQGEGNIGLRRYLPRVWWAATIGCGCNLTVRRQFALEIGGFDEALDLGADLPGGGDSEFLWRALESGGSVVYNPNILVLHEHRSEEAEVIDQIVGHHRGLMAFLAKVVQQTPVHRRLSPGLFMCWRLVKPGYRLARRALRIDPLPMRAILRIWQNSFFGFSDYSRGQVESAFRRRNGVDG